MSRTTGKSQVQIEKKGRENSHEEKFLRNKVFYADTYEVVKGRKLHTSIPMIIAIENR